MELYPPKGFQLQSTLDCRPAADSLAGEQFLWSSLCRGERERGETERDTHTHTRTHTQETGVISKGFDWLLELSTLSGRHLHSFLQFLLCFLLSLSFKMNFCFPSDLLVFSLHDFLSMWLRLADFISAQGHIKY